MNMNSNYATTNKLVVSDAFRPPQYVSKDVVIVSPPHTIPTSSSALSSSLDGDSNHSSSSASSSSSRILLQQRTNTTPSIVSLNQEEGRTLPLNFTPGPFDGKFSPKSSSAPSISKKLSIKLTHILSFAPSLFTQ